MRRFFILALAAAAILGLAPSSYALRVAMPMSLSTTQKALQAEVVVVGKVTGIEQETVEAEPFVGSPQKVAYKIAVIKIDSALIGGNGLTHIKVGFRVPATPATPPTTGRPIRPIGGLQHVQLADEQAGAFFLHKHPTAAFYTIRPSDPPVDAKAPNFKAEVAKVKVVARVIADPKKALSAEKIDERLTASATLVGKYHSYPPNAKFGVEQRAVPADITRLIMKTLLEADWDKHVNDPLLSPMNIVSQLGLHPGGNGIPIFQPRQNDPNPTLTYRAWYKAELTKWYEKNGDKFEIKENVAKEMK